MLGTCFQVKQHYHVTDQLDQTVWHLFHPFLSECKNHTHVFAYGFNTVAQIVPTKLVCFVNVMGHYF